MQINLEEMRGELEGLARKQVRSGLVEDVVQEAMMLYLTRDSGCTMTIYECLNSACSTVKEQYRKQLRYSDFDESHAVPTPDPREAMAAAARERYDHVRLTCHQRVIWDKWVYESKTTAQIAAEMGVGVRGVQLVIARICERVAGCKVTLEEFRDEFDLFDYCSSTTPSYDGERFARK